jgi:flagellar hook-associated protein 2
MADPSGFITIKGVQITPPGGSATNVAAAINGANLGVRASVIQTVDGKSVLQLSSSIVGSDGAFTVDPGNLLNPPTDIQAARNARIEVGDPLAGGYAVESKTNTFTGVIPGVTFTVTAPADNVTINVNQDTDKITSRVQALVNAANNIASELSNDTQQGSPLQGTSALNQLRSALGNSVSYGTVGGKSLFDYGIDMDKNGVISFDADKFKAAYSADASGTKDAINGFANSLKATASTAIDPTYGSLTLTMSQITDTEARLNDSITAWNDRLDMLQANLQAKFLAMQTSLATLQSRQTYLTSMFKSMDPKSNS